MHSRPHYEAHTGKKLVDGRCQCFVKGSADNVIFAPADELMLRVRERLERDAARAAGVAAGQLTPMSGAKAYRGERVIDEPSKESKSELMRFAEHGPEPWTDVARAYHGLPDRILGWGTLRML